MTLFRQHFSAATLTTSIALALATPAPNTVWAQATNASARAGSMSESFFAANQLRASGQRIARLYLESGLGIRPNKTRQLLEQEIKGYEMLLAELQRQRGDATLQKHVGRTTAAWLELKPLVTGKFGKQNAELAYANSEQLYIQTSKLTSHLEGQAESEAGYLADVAGRNGAFAERIAKAAFLFAITKNTSSMVDFETWKKEYTDGFDRLESSTLNDDYARGNLKLGRMMWVLFDDTITGAIKKNDTTRMLDIAKSVDGMWDIAQSSKKQYEVMFRQQMKQPGVFASQPPPRKGT